MSFFEYLGQTQYFLWGKKNLFLKKIMHLSTKFKEKLRDGWKTVTFEGVAKRNIIRDKFRQPLAA